MSINANYGGTSGNNTSYIRKFNQGTPLNLWTTTIHENDKSLTPASSTTPNVFIPGNLYVNGSIINPSDIYLKNNVLDISDEMSDNIMKLRPVQYVLNGDLLNKIHYGFIAQELEEHLPELVFNIPNKNLINMKGINYLEILPLLVYKIQKMQNEIDILKTQLGKI
jgi:hypothetical protein